MEKTKGRAQMKHPRIDHAQLVGIPGVHPITAESFIRSLSVDDFLALADGRIEQMSEAARRHYWRIKESQQTSEQAE